MIPPGTESLSLGKEQKISETCSKGDVPLLNFHGFLVIWADGQSRAFTQSQGTQTQHLSQ